MARWIVFGETVIGDVEAATRAEAEQQAVVRFPNWAGVRVQSRASWDVAQDERRAIQRDRTVTE